MIELNETGKYPNQAKTLEEIINSRELYIHEGTFHMDDVMCAAMIIKLQEQEKGPDYGLGGSKQLKINRGRYDIPKDFDGVICDCLGGYFDHHRAIVNHRDNSSCPEKENQMASMGCLNQVIGKKLFGDKFDEVDEIIKKWDLADLGVAGDFLSLSIGRMNPLTDKQLKKQFNEALSICYNICSNLTNEKTVGRDYDSIINSYFEERVGKPLKVYKYNELKEDVEVVYDDISSILNDPNMLSKLKSFSKNGWFMYNDLQNPDSSLRQVLDRFNQEDAEKFMYKLLDSERYYTLTQENISSVLGNIRDVAEKEKVDVVQFTQFPGDVKIFDGAPFNFIITPQLNTKEVAVYAVGEKFIGEGNGAPTPRMGFPVKFKGNINILRDSTERLESLYEYIEDSKDDEELDGEIIFEVAALTDTKTKDIERMDKKELLSFIKENVDNNHESIKFMDKYHISFIHKDGFLAQVENSSYAEQLLNHMYSNEDYLKHWNSERGKFYLKKMEISKVFTPAQVSEFSEFFSEENSSNHSSAVLGLFQHEQEEANKKGELLDTGLLITKMRILDSCKNHSDISLEVANLLGNSSFPLETTREIVNENLSKSSLNAIIKEFSDEDSNHIGDISFIKENLEILKFRDYIYSEDFDTSKKKEFAEALEERLESIDDKSSSIYKSVTATINSLQTEREISSSNEHTSVPEVSDKIKEYDISLVKFAKPLDDSIEVSL